MSFIRKIRFERCLVWLYYRFNNVGFMSRKAEKPIHLKSQMISKTW